MFGCLIYTKYYDPKLIFFIMMQHIIRILNKPRANIHMLVFLKRGSFNFLESSGLLWECGGFSLPLHTE